MFARNRERIPLAKQPAREAGGHKMGDRTERLGKAPICGLAHGDDRSDVAIGKIEVFLFAMPSFPVVFLCALAELVISVCVGWPMMRRLGAPRPVALALAPAAGWAAFNPLALSILTATGFTRATVALLSGGAVVGGLAISLRQRLRAVEPRRADISVWALAAAALLALVPAVAVWPKFGAGGVVLSEAMFDHSKAAIIDDIVRLGLPPGNPFFAGSGPRLVYYYLWHFSAAIPAALFGASGWEADIALTWFTAFASLCLMAGLAALFAGRKIAALFVVLLSLSASLKPVLGWLLPATFLGRTLAQNPWPESWIFQASWAPQHLASAGCVVVAVFVLSRLAASRDWLVVPLLAVVVAAGFESSAWVGGVIFAAAALPIGIALLVMADDRRSRVHFLLQGAVAVILAVAITSPFLRDQYVATVAREAGAPLAFHPFEVLGPIVPAAIRPALNLFAFWLLLMSIQFPAIYFAGIWAMAAKIAEKGWALAEQRLAVALGLLAGASFAVPWLFASTIANNDLGWRGVLPGMLVLTIFAAAGIAQWLASARGLAVGALVFWTMGIPGGLQITRENVAGLKTPSAAIFAGAPELWDAVRRHTAPDERVANNPSFLADSARWPVNISWALLADRRSCYAGWNLARAFVPLPGPEIDRISVLFKRVFAGDASSADIHDLATRFDCRVVVVTPSDGAWRRDLFANSTYFRLVEERVGRWRIYRAVDGLRDRM